MYVTHRKQNVDDQINKLQSTTVILEAKSYVVSHKLIFTMVDGKIYNALLDTTSI